MTVESTTKFSATKSYGSMRYQYRGGVTSIHDLTNSQFADGISEWIQCNATAQLNEPYEKYGIQSKESSTRLYMVSVNLIPFDTSNADSRVEIAWKRYRKLRLALNNKIQTKNNRPRNHIMLPISYDFIDFPGSKHNKPHYDGVPHFHSIFSVHPAKVQSFEAAILEFQENGTRFLNPIGIEDIHFQPVRNLPSDLKKVVGYDAKSATSPVRRNYLSREASNMMWDAFQ